MRSPRPDAGPAPPEAFDRVARTREVFERFNEGGADAILDEMTPDIRVIPFPEWPDDPLYVGRDGFRKLVAEWTENFDGYRWEVDDIRETATGVLILARHGGRTKGEGVFVDQPVSAVYRFRGEQVEEMRFFLTWDEAFEAGAQ